MATNTMPQYKSHKTVWAQKIDVVSIKRASETESRQDEYTLLLENGDSKTFRVGDLLHRPIPRAGWYYVIYGSIDGYFSFSPANEFENGYTLVTSSDSEDHPHAKSADFRSFSQDQMKNWFSYHAPTPEQIIQYGEIRTAAKVFAETINRHVPHGADKTAAMRKLRETVMAANLAVACFEQPEQNI